MESNNSCRFCHSKAELICHRCRDPYCSRQCQEKDWFDHKLICFPIPNLVKAVDVKNVHIKSEQKVHDKGPQQIQVKIAANVPVSPAREIKVSSSANSSSVDRNAKIEKPMEKKILKPTDNKWDQVDVNSIRKPGVLSQVIRNNEPPKQTSTEYQPKNISIEPPKQAASVQQPKIISTEPLKQAATVQQPKIVPTEPPKQAPTVQQTKSVPMEPPKQAPTVQQQKSIPTEPPKQATIVEQPKRVPSEPPKEPTKLITVEKAQQQLKKVEVLPIPKEIDLRPWMQPSPIEERTFVDVVVQYVAKDSTTWVSLAKHVAKNTDLLRIINKNISFTSKPGPADVTENSLYFVPFEGIYYRGIVLDSVSPKGTVTVRLVDYGNDFVLPVENLRTPLPAVSNDNAYAFPIKFTKHQKVAIGNELKIKKETMEGNVMVVSVKEDMEKILTMKDIEIVPIPVGSSIKLFAMDFSNLGQGYISASVADPNAVKLIEEMTPKITNYCNECKDEYSPQVDELCFAKFNDGQWYRANTQKVIGDDSYEILFIDFGNVIPTKSSSLRKMSDEFLFKCTMNFCFIKDLPVSSNEHIMKMARFFNDNQIFEAKSVEKEENKYLIEVAL